MSYRNRMIDTAKTIIAELYNVPEDQLSKVGLRTRNIMEGRRLLIFYLNRFVGIKHLHMKKHINGLCHATSIHHCNKMEWFIEHELSVKHKYNELLSKMKQFDVRNEIIKDKLESVIKLQAEINNYLKKQDDKRI